MKLNLDKNKSLIIGSLYHSPNNDADYMDKLSSTAQEVAHIFKNAVLWLGGDLNLPDIKWSTQTIEGSQYPFCINQRFLDMQSNFRSWADGLISYKGRQYT